MMTNPASLPALPPLRRLAAAAALALLVAALPARAQAQPDLSTIEERIVTVRVFGPMNILLGEYAGLAVADGVVLANAHMVRGAETIEVVTGDGTVYAAMIRSSDNRSGVAILDAEGVEAAAPLFAVDDADQDPEVEDMVYVPRFAADGSLADAPTRGLISEVNRLAAITPGERPLLIYTHNARVSDKEYGMPMLNACGEIIGVIRPDPDFSLRALNGRQGPGASTFGLAGAEVRQALAAESAEVETAAEPCVESLEAEAQAAREAAEAAAAEVEEAQAEAAAARERAEEAEAERDAVEADAEATEAERDAAREEAEEARAAAEQQEAELDDLEQRADAARNVAQQAQAQVEELERQQRLLYVALAGAGVLLFAVVIGAWALLRRRRREREAAEEKQREADEKRKEAEEELAGAVKPAPFSCLLEGADDGGRRLVVKVEAAQLGAPEGVVVGRNPRQAGVLFDHPEASREHFRLTVRDGGLYLRDLRSTNGTFVNGAEAPPGKEVKLSDGDRIGIGGAIEVLATITPHQQS